MPHANRPLVSVVMATYNDEPRFLEAAIGSIAAQSYGEWQLVVVDDSTNDETRSLLDRFAGELGAKMLLARNDKRLGFVRSINRGIELAGGELIARMDGDDIAAPDRLAAQVDYLREHQDVGILGGYVRIIAEDGSPLAVRRYKSSRAEIERTCFIRNPLAHPAVMMRRSVLESIGSYDESFKKAEDYELWLRALKRSVRIENLPQVLIDYRVQRDYSAKRDKSNWSFAVKAKLKNFNGRRPLRSAFGLCLSLGMALLPRAVLNRLYARDHESPILYG